MNIDLAPNHKQGLSVANPILLGCGAIGYGEAIPKGLDVAALGAVVVGPILNASRGGAQPPRLAHVAGGVVLETGLQNRGVGKILSHFARYWPRLGCPVIVQVADDRASILARTLARLAEAEGLHGIELLPPPDADASLVAALVRTAERASELPIWVKLPLAAAVTLAPAAVDAGAVGLVVGQPPQGAALRRMDGIDLPVRGPLYGPLAFPPMLLALLGVAALQLPAALIASGGIHTAEQVRQALAAGAAAVQIDSALWVEPGLAGRLARSGASV
jgi:dihydroorotate dehydrogenase (NAD+) catalytic subunit